MSGFLNYILLLIVYLLFSNGFLKSILKRIKNLLHLPQCVEDFPVVPDAEQLIGSCNPMSVCVLRISEDGVRYPDKSHHVAVQSQYFHRAVISEATVRPRLGKNDVDLIFL